MENILPTAAGQPADIQSITGLDTPLSSAPAELLEHHSQFTLQGLAESPQLQTEHSSARRSDSVGRGERLFRAGFVEIIGVIPPGAQLSPHSKLRPESTGKIPGRKTPEGWAGHHDWPKHETTLAEAMQWDLDGSSIGVRTGRICAVDIDVTDEALASELRILALSHLGDTCTRVGNAPKVLLPYASVEDTARSRQLAFTGGMLEILGRGRHFVAHGNHPKTGKLYTWDRDLVEIGLAHLPRVTDGQLDSFLGAAEQLLIAKGLAVTTHSKSRDRAIVCQESLQAPSLEILREVVSNIPNLLETTRHEWLSAGVAMKSAAGSEHEDEAFELFSEWSDRWPGGNAPECVRDTWDSLCHRSHWVGTTS